MKYICLIFSVVFLVGCSNKTEIKTGKLNPSFGARNHITVVIDDHLWNGEVGDSIRKTLAQSFFGDINEEPIFDISQYSPDIFSAKEKNSRNIVMFSNDEEYSFILEKSLWATPQNLFFVRANSNTELIQNFSKHADSIVSVFRNSELNEEQHDLIRKPHLDTRIVKELFACSIKIPQSFQLVLEKQDFLWFQKDLPSGNCNLVIYEVPISSIEDGLNNDIKLNLIKAQDSISKMYIEGLNPNSFFKTTLSFFPVFNSIKIQEFSGYEILGSWEMNNDFMSGPFYTIALKDEYFERYIFFQAFINYPLKSKRDLLFEIEAIIKNVNFYNNEI